MHGLRRWEFCRIAVQLCQLRSRLLFQRHCIHCVHRVRCRDIFVVCGKHVVHRMSHGSFFERSVHQLF